MSRVFVAIFVLLQTEAYAQGYNVDPFCEAVSLDRRADTLSDYYDHGACCDYDGGDQPYQPSRVIAFETLESVDAQSMCDHVGEVNPQGGISVWNVWGGDVGLLAQDGRNRRILFSGGSLAPHFNLQENQTIEYSCARGQLVATLYECPCGIVEHQVVRIGPSTACRSNQSPDGPIQVSPDVVPLEPDMLMVPAPTDRLPNDPTGPMISRPEG